MDNKTAALLTIVNERVPDISLSNALALVNELRSEFENDRHSALLVNAKAWAEENFSSHDVINYKIKVIKEIRSQFAIGLKEAKDITDTMTPRASWNWFSESPF